MLLPRSPSQHPNRHEPHEALARLGVDPRRPDSFPFGPADATGGSEFELQVGVAGAADRVDLPLRIRESNYFANVMERVRAEEMPRSVVRRLEDFLSRNDDGVWENSWVRIPARFLNPASKRLLRADLRIDRSDPASAPRGDANKFRAGNAVRVPVSYLLNLSLAHVAGRLPGPAERLDAIASRLSPHYLNDNSSPETHSFYVSSMPERGTLGQALARETQQRYLLTSLLLDHANARMGLAASGQRAMAWLAPQPPQRLRQLNDCVSDAFFRELFCSPCLSGWTRGQDKHAYMLLCHQVLSRSQLNTLASLREAGLLNRKRVLLPNLSSMALANNGVHVSLGSRLLSENEEYGAFSAKAVGDLAIKIQEHFLPLFVGTYSAAPYRVGFDHFVPERALGFLPHALHPTHLRMIWRRWKKKARVGLPWAPSGNPTWDAIVARSFRLRGDCVTDTRLIDYLVAVASTQRSAALDGTPGNHERLKCDLHDLGIFDERMSLYLPLKLRETRLAGYCGFEARHYSLFSSLAGDMAPAIDLQHLVTLYAFDRIARGEITHAHIPDTPFVESERRQVFFARAVGIPTFFVRKDTPNRLLREILERTPDVRSSRRYPGYVRVTIDAYCLALCEHLRERTGAFRESLRSTTLLADLRERLAQPHRSAAARLVHGIREEGGGAHVLAQSAEQFNRASERYYRGALCRSHLRESLEALEDRVGADRDADVQAILGGGTLSELFARARRAASESRPDPDLTDRLLALLLLDIDKETRRATPVR